MATEKPKAEETPTPLIKEAVGTTEQTPVKGEEPVQIPTEDTSPPKASKTFAKPAQRKSPAGQRSRPKNENRSTQRADDALNQKIYGGMSAEDIAALTPEISESTPSGKLVPRPLSSQRYSRPSLSSRTGISPRCIGGS